MRLRAALIGVVTVAAVAVLPADAAAPARTFVLSPEGNHLWVYDAASGAHQLVFRAVNGADPGMAPTSGQRDINGQICVSPSGRHVVTGEDTVLAPAGSPDGAGSHDPRIAGWGYFKISGSTLSDIRLRQVGKLAPESGPGEGYAGDPDNYGCGFLDDSRLVTSAIGDTLPGDPASGQLFLWFGPFDAGFGSATTADGVGFYSGAVPHCELDRTLATAGGIAVDRNGDVYVATNRPDDSGNPGGVFRFSGRFPTSMAECTPEFLAANVRKELVVPNPALGPVPDPRVPTPSAVAISPADTLIVSSVASGTVSEWSKDGAWLRDIWPLSPVAPRTGPTTQTPFGVAFTPDGSLWVTDLGVLVAAPQDGAGSLIRVRFDAAGNPAPLGETVRDGLTFPDGVGVYQPRR